MLRIFCIVLLGTLPMGIEAHTNWYLTKHDIVDVYDGDTFFINLKGLPEVFGDRLPVRIRGVDTPEIRSRCKDPIAKEREKILAYRARDYLKQLIENARDIRLLDITKDNRGKYFRLIADPQVDGVFIHQLLLEASLAKPMDERTFDWCIYVMSEESPFNQDIEDFDMESVDSLESQSDLELGL